MSTTTLIIIVVISELVAAWILFKLWRSDDFLFFKIAFSLMALIPVFGPLLVLWANSFPSRLPMALRDQASKNSDVFDRWIRTFEAHGLREPFKAWRRLISRSSK